MDERISLEGEVADDEANQVAAHQNRRLERRFSPDTVDVLHALKRTQNVIENIQQLWLLRKDVLDKCAVLYIKYNKLCTHAYIGAYTH